MSQAHIFVINLPQQADRRESILTQLSSIGIEAEIVQAVDGRKLSAEAIAAQHNESAAKTGGRRGMTHGEIGCALSHQSVYRRMIERGLPWAVIIEDDAQLEADFLLVLNTIVRRLDSVCPEIYLFSHVARYTNWGREKLTDRYWLVKPVIAHGGQCYLLTVAAAQALLRANYPVCVPIDNWSRFLKQGVARIRAVMPYCVGLAPCEKTSTIEPERQAQKTTDNKNSIQRWIKKYLYQKILYRLLIQYILREKKQKFTW
jgi:glycosyl transferase family 25